MNRYLNRQQAGLVLAQALQTYAHRQDVLVLGLPRGGIPVAFEIAKALQVPMDTFIVRKLGAPGQPELAMGAIAMGGKPIFNKDIIRQLHVSENAINAVIENEKKELQRRNLVYRDNRPLPDIKDKMIILVDDGIATGATMRAAIKALKDLHAKQIVVAVPVADQQLCEDMQMEVDDLICLLRPTHLVAVGAWYEDFSQTEDEEVFALLKEAQKRNLM